MSKTLIAVFIATAIAVLDPSVAIAAQCNGVAIDPRFREAARLCDGSPALSAARPAGAVAQYPTVQYPTNVSIQMSGRGGSASRPRATRAAAPTPVAAAGLLNAVGAAYRIDPYLLASMVHQESGGNLRAVSHKGALGLMQVMPGTARSMGVAEPRAMLTNPVLALSTGAVYLKGLQARFGNNVPLVLAAYNAGPGAVLRAGRRVPRYRETRGYVGSIMGRYSRSRTGRTAAGRAR